MNARPLILDVDGTLIRSDLTHELLLEGVKANPFAAPRYLALGLHSKSRMKEALVSRVADRLTVEAAPLEPKVVALARAAREEGRDVYLCSGSEHSLVKRLGDSLDFVTDSFGTTPERNLTSENKAAFLRERFPQGFDYVGNSTQDYKVWDSAHTGIAIRPPKGTESRLAGGGGSVEVIEPRKASLRPLLKAMRPHQWAKNVLIFLVPMLILERLGVADWLQVGLGFLCLSLLASGTYLVNDILDIHADRLHDTKRRRPFAAGTLSIPAGLIAAFVLIAAGLGSSLLLPLAFTGVLLVYFGVTLLYSFVLKKLAIADVITLAFLFLTRVAAGGAVIREPLSPWLISFVLTFFLTLSLVKRYTELVKAQARGKTRISGRGYQPNDALLILGFGMAATAMTLLSFVLYGVVSDIPALRTQTAVLIVGIVITYWILRLWLIAHRGELNDDPVLFAVKDRLSLVAGAVIFGTVLVERFVVL